MTIDDVRKTRTPSLVPSGWINLDDPDFSDLPWRTIVDRLARLNRFKGEPGAISVAQHCVMGAEAIAAESRDVFAAALFILHDGHEFAIGDTARDVADCLARMIGPAYRQSVDELKARLDFAIYQKAGLPAPEAWTATQRRLVAEMDERMQVVELLALYGPRAIVTYPTRARKTPLLQEGLKPWPAERAAERFLLTLSRFTGRTFR